MSFIMGRQDIFLDYEMGNKEDKKNKFKEKSRIKAKKIEVPFYVELEYIYITLYGPPR